MLFGRVSRKKFPDRLKTTSSIFSCQTWLGLQMGLASKFRWNKKTSFLAANTQDVFGEHRDKKVPYVYNEIYCCILYVVGLYFCWRSWRSCLDTCHHGFYQIPTDEKCTSDWLLEILQWANNPNTNLKNNTTMGHRAQNQASAMAIPVLWPEPCRKWVRWTEEKKLWIWRIWRDSGWMNALWSLVGCSLTSSGITGKHLELLNWQMEVSKHIE